MNEPLLSKEMTKLLTAIEEATRSSEEGIRYFVEPTEDALRRATSRRHHIVFGRRGSGKSSLLRKAAAQLTVDRRPIAWVDLEAFKGHSYPDLLISVLLKTFAEFRNWLETAAIEPASKRSFWARLFGAKPTRSPLNRAACKDLVAKIDQQVAALTEQLHAADSAEVEASSEHDVGRHDALSEKLGSRVKVAGIEASVEGTASTSIGEAQRSKLTEKFRRTKIEFLLRHVLDYQNIFAEMSRMSSGDAYLFLDDLYHLRRGEQPLVLDYFHSVAKGNRLWLKVGTIRHRSNWYVHGRPPIGMKLGDDADEIDLDLTLEKYSITKKFLSRVLGNLSEASGFASNSEFLTDSGLDRLVLASGGVARDFLAILRRAVATSRERGADSARGPKVGAEDVNIAAGDHDTAKREEFKTDTYTEETALLDNVFDGVRTFCLDKAGSNCFLIDKEQRDQRIAAIHELVDLKLLHLVRSRVTVNTRQGRLYEAYMLDLSQYAGSRKKRDLDLIEFWRADSKDRLRKASLILYERE